MTDLPDPPWRVLAHTVFTVDIWWQYDDWLGTFKAAVSEARPSELTVIDHKLNDPEAVEIIRRAKEGK